MVTTVSPAADEASSSSFNITKKRWTPIWNIVKARPVKGDGLRCHCPVEGILCFGFTGFCELHIPLRPKSIIVKNFWLALSVSSILNIEYCISFFGVWVGMCVVQLKKYGESSTSSKLKSPRSGSGGKVDFGYDAWKLSSNCKQSERNFWRNIIEKGKIVWAYVKT